MGAGGTLGLPSGLPSEDLVAPSYFEVGEATGVPSSSETPSILNDSLVRNINKQLAHHEPAIMAQRDHMRDDFRFFNTHQLSDDDVRILDMQKRPKVAFNEIQKFIKFVSGIERRTPQALLYLPRIQEDIAAQYRGEQKTRCYEWFCEQSYAGWERSLAFTDKLIGGLGFVEIGVTRITDPQGAPKYARIDPFQMLWPQSDKENLGIGTVAPVPWIARESFMDVDEAIRKWPAKAIFIRAVGGAANDDQFPDFGRGAHRPIQYVVPYIMAEPLNRNGGSQTTHPGQVPILEWQYFEDEPGYFFFDPIQRDAAWLNTSDFRKYRARLKLLYQKEITDYDELEHRVFKRCYLLQRRILLEEPKKLPTNGPRPGYTYAAMTGTWDREDKTWYGIVRVLMDPQRWSNTFARQILEIMGVQTKGGYLMETGAITTGQKRDIEENGSRPGSTNMVQSGAISGGKILPKPIPQLPQGSIAVFEMLFGLMEQLTGLSTSMLGTDQGNVPGVSLRRRLTSGLVLLAAEFDSLSRFRMREGDIVSDMMRLIADNRVVRVGGIDGQSVRFSKDLFGDADDIILDENDQDPNLRQLYTDSILQIAPILIRTGNFFPELLDYINLPVQVRQRLKQGMQQSEQQKQQMAMAGINPGGRGKARGLEEIKAGIQLTRSRALEHVAKAQSLSKEVKRSDMRAILDALKDAYEMQRAGRQHVLDENQRGVENMTKLMDIGARAKTKNGSSD